jgi:peptidoglycan/LPS O-acetylase OafA/YrhL
LAVLIKATPLFLAWLDAAPEWRVSAWWLGWVASVAVSVGLAALSYRYVEVPSMVLGKRLQARLWPVVEI